jgi:phosphopantetheinyl transferase (holo-ACP synthase)
MRKKRFCSLFVVINKKNDETTSLAKNFLAKEAFLAIQKYSIERDCTWYVIRITDRISVRPKLSIEPQPSLTVDAIGWRSGAITLVVGRNKCCMKYRCENFIRGEMKDVMH